MMVNIRENPIQSFLVKERGGAVVRFPIRVPAGEHLCHLDRRMTEAVPFISIVKHHIDKVVIVSEDFGVNQCFFAEETDVPKKIGQMTFTAHIGKEGTGEISRNASMGKGCWNVEMVLTASCKVFIVSPVFSLNIRCLLMRGSFRKSSG